VSLHVAAGAALAALAVVLGLGYAYTRYHERRARDRSPRQGRLLEAAGTRVHHVDQGQGPVVLFVHGLSGFLEDFTYGGLVPRTAEAGLRAVALDRPGYGSTPRAGPDQADVRRQADALVDLLDALDVHQALLVGHSLGGAVALTAALRHRHRVRGLVLVSPYAYPRTDPDGRVHRLPRLPGLRRLLLATLAAPIARLLEPGIVSASFEPRPVPEAYHRLWLDRVLRPGAMDTTLEEIHQIDPALGELTPRYPELDLPVTVLVGDRDASVDPDANARRLARELPDAELTVLEGEGHMLPVTLPELVLDAVRDVHERAADRTDAGTARREG